MKTTIFYFSATGNSLHVAKAIAAQIDGSTPVPMLRSLNAETAAAGTACTGFVFPTHYFGMPPLVTQFIKKLDMEQAQYSFAVTTCGSRLINSGLRQVGNLLRQKGKRLAAGFHIEMISSYIPLSDLPPLAKQQQRLAAADRKIENIIGAVRAQASVYEPEYLWLPSVAINNFWRQKLLGQADQKFSCSSACSSCGVCEKVCPADNIRLVKGKPAWRHRCLECLACLHFCPVHSIDFGSRTAGRRRYHHPAVQVSEIIKAKASNPR
ncbi:EFR1 family ferrodoxin [Sporomusa termitida]|uniref:4Fe-4S ferredoxin-type domain-containing protein n=1 Tax=Sporomusa termitida TaxID=2377 RepID=A0A517DZY8_9FIRM|nr:EFR1 family ferrodoxin [Sporomusa termitida]QDR82917.1 hypothetical protein SPTER_43660 [Sporomusa termitida]